MAGTFKQIVSTIFFVTMIMNFPAMSTPEITVADQVQYGSPPECPYPCLPPPTGTTTYPPPPPSQPAQPPPSGSGSYPPPSVYYPPPTGYLPYTPSPPYSRNNFPPPPDPILPYFPFYFKHPINSSATSLKRSILFLILHLLWLSCVWFSTLFSI